MIKLLKLSTQCKFIKRKKFFTRFALTTEVKDLLPGLLDETDKWPIDFQVISKRYTDQEQFKTKKLEIYQKNSKKIIKKLEEKL